MELVLLGEVFLVGLFAGFINVIVGGGSAIMVPFLMAMGFPPKSANALNRFAMIFNNGIGATGYARAGKMRWHLALSLSVPAALGSLIGAFLMIKADPDVFRHVIIALLFAEVAVATISMFFKTKIATVGLNERQEIVAKHYILAGFIGLAIGTYGGFIGMSMTSILMFVIVVLFRQSCIESAASAKVATFVISLVATLVFLVKLKLNWADWTMGGFLALAYAFGAWAGVKTSIAKGNRWVKGFFILVVSSLATYLLLLK